MERVIEVVDDKGQRGPDMVQFEEVLIPKCYADQFPNHSVQAKLKQIRDLKYSDGDVMLCSFPKTVPFGPYADYLKTFEMEIKKEKGADILVVYYEDLVQNGLEEMRRVQRHIGCNHSDERLQAIIDRCSIENLRNDIIAGRTHTVITDKTGYPVIYRKGAVGDWKNYFTVAQSETFDALWNKQMEYSMFHFRYT